ncbi:MAG: AAA-like domain-containing protein [Chloroflexota bacterium]
MSNLTLEAIHTALLDAFPTESSLDQMVQFRLNTTLEHVVGDGNLPTKLLALLRWVESTGRLDELIQGAVRSNPGNPLLQQLVQEMNLPIANDQPPAPNHQPPTTIESPMGTMSPDSPFYIERPADGECKEIFRSGNPFTLYIQAPRQMGKSSLMQRLLHFAQQEMPSMNVAFVDFEQIAKAQLADIDTFLIGLCLLIGRELKVPEKIDDYWSSKYLSPLVKCSDYIFDYLLANVEGHVVIAMDEVEKVLGLPFQDDFFGMLRTWHNDRAIDKNKARCCLFLSSSTEPELFIQNPNQSPFNVAHLMVLHSFGPDDVAKLNQLHGTPLQPEEVKHLYTFLGGHPYLTRQALYTSAMSQSANPSQSSYRQLVEDATSDESPFRTHLQNLWRHIEERPDLRTALGQIIHNGKHQPDQIYYRLKGAGLVRRDGERVRMCNQLYTDYFTQRL